MTITVTHYKAMDDNNIESLTYSAPYLSLISTVTLIIKVKIFGMGYF